MGDVTFTSAVLRGADVTIKSDRLVPTFSGRSADWSDYVDSLVSHFQGRGLDSFFALSVHDFMSVLQHDTAQDNALVYRLGDAGKRSLARVYDVRAARATPQAPRADESDGLFSSPPVHGDGGGGQAMSSPSTRYRLTVGQDTVDVETVSPDAEVERSKARKVVLDKLELIHDARAFPPGHRVCTVSEWVAVSSTIHRIIMHNASPSVKLSNSRLQPPCGIDLFLILLEKHGTAKRFRTMVHMQTIRTPYLEALANSDCTNVLDYLDNMLNARLKLTGMSDEVFMIHIGEGLVGSDVSDYVKQAMNTNGMTVDEMIMGIQDRASNKDMLRDSADSKQVQQGTNAKVHATKVNCICQLCGEYGHGAMQCKKYPKVKEVIQEHRARSADDPQYRVLRLQQEENRFCGHCQKPGHTIDKCFDLHPELMHCRACNQKGHLKGSDKCEKAASKTKEVKANQVQLSDADLKTIAEYIKVSVKTADVQVSPGGPAGSTSPFFPPRIQIPGLNR
jgi:hypothetical protein